MGFRYLSEKNVAMKASQNIESIIRLRFSPSEKSTVKYITITPTTTDTKIYDKDLEEFNKILKFEDQIKNLDNEKLPNFISNNFEFDKKNINRNDVNDFIIFFEKSGLKKLILNGITNLRDYYMGVEWVLTVMVEKIGVEKWKKLFKNLLINVYQLNINHEFTKQRPNQVSVVYGICCPSINLPDRILL